MNSPDDLDFLSTEALLENLAKRFDACLFIAHSERSAVENAITFFNTGSAPTVLGLAQMAFDHLREPMEPESE